MLDTHSLSFITGVIYSALNVYVFQMDFNLILMQIFVYQNVERHCLVYVWPALHNSTVSPWLLSLKAILIKNMYKKKKVHSIVDLISLQDVSPFSI